MTPEHQEILDSFHRSLPAILEGRDPRPIVWGARGKLQNWDRAPVFQVGPSAEEILAAICEVSGETKWDILGPRRNIRLARARQVACYLIKIHRPNMSFPHIGRFMGDRDHTTIMHAVRKVEDLLASGDEFTCTIYNTAQRALT